MNKLNEILHSATRKLGGGKKAKRIALISIVAVIIVTMISATFIINTSDDSVAEDIDYLQYTLNADGTATVIGLTTAGAAKTEIKIPGEVEHSSVKYSVTAIGDFAFNGCRGLTSVTIPNTVTSIGIGAFYLCTSITSVTIPNTVTSIGVHVFNGCTALESVTIPNTVTSIGDFAFNGCKGLTSVTIPNSVTTIGIGAFSGCTSLKSVTIPNSVTTIGDSAFSSCSGLTSVTIPNSVTSIGDRVFNGCTALTFITMSNSVTSIGRGVFNGCTALTSVTVTGTGTVSENNVISKYFTNGKWGLPGRTEGITTLTLNFASDYAYDVSKITISIADKTLIFGVNAKATTGGGFYGANGLPITGESRAGLTFFNSADGKWITNSSPDPVDPSKPAPSSTDASNVLYLGFAVLLTILLASLVAILFRSKKD